ncbi:MAG: tetratricopeptide repeat protein [Armatimonadota bacterium]
MTSNSQNTDVSLDRQPNPYAGKSLGELHALAATLESNQRWEDLSALLDHLLTQHPQDATIWFKKGLVLQRRGLLEEAVRALERAVALQPDEAKIAQVLETIREARRAEQATSAQPNAEEAPAELTYQQQVIARYFSELTSHAHSLEQRLHAAYSLKYDDYQVAKEQLHQALAADAELRRAIIAKHDIDKRCDANRLTHWVEEAAIAAQGMPPIAGNGSKGKGFINNLFAKKPQDCCLICGNQLTPLQLQQETFSCPMCGAKACMNCAPLGGKPMCLKCKCDMQ